MGAVVRGMPDAGGGLLARPLDPGDGKDAAAAGDARDPARIVQARGGDPGAARAVGVGLAPVQRGYGGSRHRAEIDAAGGELEVGVTQVASAVEDGDDD